MFAVSFEVPNNAGPDALEILQSGRHLGKAQWGESIMGIEIRIFKQFLELSQEMQKIKSNEDKTIDGRGAVKGNCLQNGPGTGCTFLRLAGAPPYQLPRAPLLVAQLPGPCNCLYCQDTEQRVHTNSNTTTFDIIVRIITTYSQLNLRPLLQSQIHAYEWVCPKQTRPS